jgi:predicted acetyltransferase
MNKNNLLVRYDKDLRLRIMYPEARKEITSDVVRFIRQAPGMNFVGFTFANETRLHEVIHQEVEYFTLLKQPFTWKVYDHDRLPNLQKALETHGYDADEDPAAVMVLDVQRADDSLFQPVQADIRRIETAEDLKDIVHVLDKVWGGHNTWVYDRLGGHLQIPGYLSVYAAYVDNRPASIAWTYFPRGHFATLFAGSTVVEYRKQGLYTGLLATRLKEIRERGYRFAIVEAGAMSKPIVSKHGFQQLTTVYDFEWKRN